MRSGCRALLFSAAGCTEVGNCQRMPRRCWKIPHVSLLPCICPLLVEQQSFLLSLAFPISHEPLTLGEPDGTCWQGNQGNPVSGLPAPVRPGSMWKGAAMVLRCHQSGSLSSGPSTSPGVPPLCLGPPQNGRSTKETIGRCTEAWQVHFLPQPSHLTHFTYWILFEKNIPHAWNLTFAVSRCTGGRMLSKQAKLF